MIEVLPVDAPEELLAQGAGKVVALALDDAGAVGGAGDGQCRACGAECHLAVDTHLVVVGAGVGAHHDFAVVAHHQRAHRQ